MFFGDDGMGDGSGMFLFVPKYGLLDECRGFYAVVEGFLVPECLGCFFCQHYQIICIMYV